ncbi:ABC transporter substrate-binding protein [Gulosibacter molinativorax]|uniref:Ribose ABC transporter substrate-binding protein n=1 Tax=Gulosibacter molinativorax TaxID=256821 RepID=A0ABT7C4U3_9MICO|nr:ABC transporter substrate-binding protein [Gulosibacter molinativorax]MDJ1370222.1 ribose ABC transporter substrate-binding protein [Gulosibacter molinativorax]QUY61635.1 ABC transporter substrate binding protein [Gulosibacter molinativorax]
MKTHKIAVSFVAIALATSLAACTSSKPVASEEKEDQPKTSAETAVEIAAPDRAGSEYDISLLIGVVGDPFFITMGCQAQEEAERLGVTVDVQGPQKYDPTLQRPILDSIIASKPDALLMVPTDAQALQQPLEMAVASGIEVALLDTTTSDPSFAVSEISTDNEAAGAAAFDAIKQLHPEGGKVMVMGLEAGVSATDARTKGFEDAVASDPSFTYVGVEYSRNDPATAASIIGARLQKDPDLVGVFAANIFAAEGTATGVKQAGKSGEVQIVAVDAGENQLAALREGTVQALIAQDPGAIGINGVRAVVSALDGVDVPNKVATKITVITRDNVDAEEGRAAAYKTGC